MNEWLEAHRAAKAGRPAPPPNYPPPPPNYGPPPPSYPPQAPQAPYVPPPQPQGPPHAPFGYDPQTGVPLAPYGHDQTGRVIVQPYYQQPVQQQYYDPNGLPAPQGYGQPPYGPAGQQQQPQYGDPHTVAHLQPIPTGQDIKDKKVNAFDAAFEWRGGKGVESVGTCDICGGPLIPFSAANARDAGNGFSHMNSSGQTVYAAPQCSQCGNSGKFVVGEGYGVAAMSGGGVVMTGAPRLAPGAGSVAQVQAQSGTGNLFAART